MTTSRLSGNGDSLTILEWRAVAIDHDDPAGVSVDVGCWTDHASARSDLHLLRLIASDDDEIYLERRAVTYTHPERIDEAA